MIRFCVPPKLNSTAKTLFLNISSCCIFLGITSGVLTLWSWWEIHLCKVNTTKLWQIDGCDCQTFSGSVLRLSDGCLVAALWIFPFDPECFCVNLDLTLLKIGFLKNLILQKLFDPLVMSSAEEEKC